jgi:putative endonuclease
LAVILNLFQDLIQFLIMYDKKETKHYYVYILTNKSNEVLYIGMTNNLMTRVYQHKNKRVEGFSKKYNLTKLVYYEIAQDVKSAIMSEKQLKIWHREWKFNLITSSNPGWIDLSKDFT